MVMRRKQTVIALAILVVILVLEILPCGAVLHFANPEGEPFRETFSYFDLTPYGYANFGPFITAILTCVLLVLSVIKLFVDKGEKAIKIISIIALITSLMPLLVNCYSMIGGAISILLLAVFIISLTKKMWA